ncbi:GNAT family N-acetyltransferase [Fictibacillus nanhaiensis]|uniref:GNAT family N-acetyltransferase n=1 Tax=Fictibacillus nanhaiensis TaxID=742169 RepID=UPI002E1AD3AF|nr:GNAT family N-acetyltransferase [Fictibacillus nanhaiensis]MED1863789.1 GNAT family N-acetyltransferase [Fictibacillus nanhaiensis]
MHTEDEVELKVEQFNDSDVSNLIELSSSVCWDYDDQEIKTILSSGKIFGHKNSKGKIVSSAAIVPYDTNLASIGMVIVHSDYRGFGLGKKVTQQCIARVSKETSIMLISTEDGKPLYESLNFRTVDAVHKFLCEDFVCATLEVNNEFTLETYKVGDFHQVMVLDSAAFGGKRSKFLHNRIEQSKRCIVVKNQNREIVGFGLSVQGPINLLVGPVVAPDFKTAASIMKELAANHHGNLRIDVPSGHHDFMTFLHTCGFNKVNEPPVMMKNSSTMPHRDGRLYGIAAQVFG